MAGPTPALRPAGLLVIVAGPLGVVLAGGKSSRMGTDKALVEVAGIPMIAWVVTALESVSSGILVAGREGRMVGYECVPDRDSEAGSVAGPLAGLVTVIERVQPPQSLVVVAVDHPFVKRATLGALVERFDGGRVVVPIADGVRQVTVAVYPASIRREAEAQLVDGGSLQTLLDEVEVDEVDEEEWRRWGEDGRSWFGVDKPDDVAAGLTSFGLPIE